MMFCLLVLVSFVPTGAFSITAFAETRSGTTGDCTWTLDGTVLTISGNGAMANYNSKDIKKEFKRIITDKDYKHSMIQNSI